MTPSLPDFGVWFADQAARVVAEPIRWMNGGCDLEMDIVPAVQKTVAAAARRGARLMGWAYFSEAVIEARDRRLTPVTAPVARTAPPREPWQIRRDDEKVARDRAEREIAEFWANRKATA